MAKTTTDHKTIQKWAERHGGKPAAVDRTHGDGDVGIIRIMFPKNKQSEHDSLVEISWDEFFSQFDESRLALLYEDDSMFSKIVGRDTVERREHGENDASRHKGRDQSDGHARQSAVKGGKSEDGKGKAAQKGDGSDLRSREYRDEDGTIHHHTRTYMEQHEGERKGR